MKRFKINFKNREYDAVMLDGSYLNISYDIIIAENQLDKDIADVFERDDKLYSGEASRIDSTISGFASKELVVHGTLNEIINYVRELYN